MDDAKARIGLMAICSGFLIVTLDALIVNVALGPIVADLGGSLSGAQWVVSSYVLVFATFLLTMGAWSGRIGSRGAYLIGLGIFAVASAACAAAPTMATLIAARAVLPLVATIMTIAFTSARLIGWLGEWRSVIIGLCGGTAVGFSSPSSAATRPS